jgi:hypothetical protein
VSSFLRNTLVRPSNTDLIRSYPARLIIAVMVPVMLSGCAVAAAPCRISAAVIKTVPVVGKVVALPLDACAEIID